MSKTKQALKPLEYQLKEDLRQKDLEAWNAAFMLLPRLGTAGQHGAAVRAAIAAGWIVEPTTRYAGAQNGTGPQYLLDGVDVGDMHPAHVFQLGEAIDRLYQELTTIPKK